MFRCQRCHQTTQPGEPQIRQVVQTRTITHPHRPKAFIAPPDPKRRLAKRKRPRLDDKGGLGPQIVREIVVCPACAN